MSILFVLLVASLGMALLFLLAFFWAVKSGQYEDTETPGMRVLLDEEEMTDSPNSNKMQSGDCRDGKNE